MPSAVATEALPSRLRVCDTTAPTMIAKPASQPYPASPCLATNDHRILHTHIKSLCRPPRTLLCHVPKDGEDEEELAGLTAEVTLASGQVLGRCGGVLATLFSVQESSRPPSPPRRIIGLPALPSDRLLKPRVKGHRRCLSDPGSSSSANPGISSSSSVQEVLSMARTVVSSQMHEPTGLPRSSSVPPYTDINLKKWDQAGELPVLLQRFQQRREIRSLTGLGEPLHLRAESARSSRCISETHERIGPHQRSQLITPASGYDQRLAGD